VRASGCRVNQGNGAIDSLLHKHSFVVTASLNPS
jgi:hypothetical protein